MDIYARQGTRVKFTAAGGHDSEKDSAKKILVLGGYYTVDKTIVDRCHTDIYLQEVPGKYFNSCLFEDLNLFDHAEKYFNE